MSQMQMKSLSGWMWRTWKVVHLLVVLVVAMLEKLLGEDVLLVLVKQVDDTVLAEVVDTVVEALDVLELPLDAQRVDLLVVKRLLEEMRLLAVEQRPRAVGARETV